MKKLFIALLVLFTALSASPQLIQKVGPGEYATYNIKSDGTLWSSSTNLGLLGTGNTGKQGLPNRVLQQSGVPLPTFKAIYVGLDDITAISTSGDVWHVGGSNAALAGDGTTNNNDNLDHKFATKVTTDSAGDNFTDVVMTSQYFSSNECRGWYAVKSNGTLWIWGSDPLGAYTGTGNAKDYMTRPYNITSTIPGGRLVAQVTSGYFTMVRCTDGTVWTWGGSCGSPSAAYGYVCTGNDYKTPHQVTGVNNATWIDGGEGRGFAICGSANDSVMGWGKPYLLGVNDIDGTPITTPIKVSSIWNFSGGRKVTKIVSNNNASHLILNDGSLWGFGTSPQGEVGNGTHLDRNRGLIAPEYPQLGCFQVLKSYPAFWSWDYCEKLFILTPARILPERSDFVNIYGGQVYCYWTFAEAANGQLYFNGRNKGGVANDGVINQDTASGLQASKFEGAWDISTPIPVDPFSLRNAILVPAEPCILYPSAGYDGCQTYSSQPYLAPTVSAGNDQPSVGTSVNLIATGSVQSGRKIGKWVWSQVSGPLGSYATFSTLNDSVTTVTGLTSGTYVFRVTLTDNLNSSNYDDISVTSVTSGGGTYTGGIQVGLGEYTCHFIANDGTLTAIGNQGFTGVGGNGSQSGAIGIPALVKDTNQVTVPKVKYVAGHFHGAAFVDVFGYCWTVGATGGGEPGLGIYSTYSPWARRIEVDSLGNPFTGIKKVVAAAQSTGDDVDQNGWLAIKENGDLYVWGTLGHLRGDGTNNPTAIHTRPYKVTIPGNRAVQDIVGGDYIMVLCTDGTVWTWGEGDYVNLGYTPAAGEALSPHDIGLTSITQIAGGKGFNFAVKSDGKLYGWGSNGNCMNEPNGLQIPFPKELVNIENYLPANIPIQKIVTNAASVTALMANGALYAWGDNSQGSVGNGVTMFGDIFGNDSAGYTYDYGMNPNWKIFQRTPVNIAPNHIFKNVFAGNMLTYYTYALEENDQLYAWGPSRASNIANQIDQPVSGALNCFDNSYNRVWPQPVNPFAITTSYVSTSPECIKSNFLSTCLPPQYAPSCQSYVMPANTKPTAIITAPSTITLPTSTVTLHGETSTDNLFISYYYWEILSKPAGSNPVIDLPASPTPVVSNMSVAGVYQFRLRVIDNGWMRDSIVKNVTVQTSGPDITEESHDFIHYDTLVDLLGGNNEAKWWIRVSRPRHMFTPGHADNAPRPVIIFMPGQSGVGHWNFESGPHKLMSYTYTDINNQVIQHPTNWDGRVEMGNGRHYPIYISVAPQTISSTTRSIGAVLLHLLSYYHIKPNAVHLTGLSMGAIDWEMLLSVQNGDGIQYDYKTKITSIAALSGSGEVTGQAAWLRGRNDYPYHQGTDLEEGGTPGPPDYGAWGGAKKWVQNGGKYFTLEETVAPIIQGYLWIGTQAMNAAVPGSAFFSYYPWGHCCWDAMYDPNYTNWLTGNQVTTGYAPNTPGTYKTGQSIFRWMLAQGDTSMVGGVSTPQPPVVAIPAGNQTITLPTNSVSLLATANDPEGGAMTYIWSKTSGPSGITITTPTALTTNITNMTAGSYNFRFIATDNQGLKDTADVGITVNAPVIQPPTANAGSNQTIILPVTQVTMAGSGAIVTAGQVITSKTWTKVSGGTATITDPSSYTTSITNLTAGVYVFRLTVIQTDNQTATSDVTITVNSACTVQSGVETSDLVTEDNTITVPGAGVWRIIITRPRHMFDGTGPTLIDTFSRPAIIFMCGAGEVLQPGVGTGNTRLYGPHGTYGDNGMPIVMGNGTHYPIYISLSPYYQWPSTESCRNLLNYLLSTYHIKRNSVHLTGLSMGAMSWTRMINSGTVADREASMKLVKSIAGLQGQANGYYSWVWQKDNPDANHNDTILFRPLYQLGNDIPTTPETTADMYTEPLTIDYKGDSVTGKSVNPLSLAWKAYRIWAVKYGGRYFNLTGTQDYSGPEGYWISEAMNDSLPGSAYFAWENICGGQHMCWDQMYDPNHTDWTSVGSLGPGVTTGNPAHPNTMGTYKTGQSIFKWMFAQGDTLIVGSASCNQPPTANAGPNQTITLPVSTVTLSGSGTAGSGGTLSYGWSQVSGPSSTITGGSSASTTVTGMTTAGTYVYRLTVTEGAASATSDVTITVNPVSGSFSVVVTNTNPLNITSPTASLTSTSSSPNGIASTKWTKFSVPNQAAKTMLIVGSSTAACNGVSGPTGFDSCFVTRFQAYYQPYGILGTITNRAQAGTTPNDFNITTNLSTYPTDIVLCAWPSNDYTAANNTTYLLRLQEWKDSILGRGRIFKIMGTQPRNDFSVADRANLVVFNDSLRNRFGADFIDVLTPLLNTADNTMKPEYNADGIHPNNAGHRIIFQKVINANILQSFASSASTISTPTANNTTVTGLVSGTHRFLISSIDNSGFAESALATVNVNIGNQSPIADAGIDQVITLPVSSTSLLGSGSDPDGTIASYAWGQVGGTAGIQASIANSTTTTPGVTGMTTAGTYLFELTVTDNGGATDKDTMQVTINPLVVSGTRTINVNMYSGGNPYNNTQWNNQEIVQTYPYTSSYYNYSDGTLSSIRTIISAYQGNSAYSDNGVGYPTVMCPPEVGRYANYYSGTRTVTFTGLDNSKLYDIIVYCSRKNATGEVTRNTIGATVIDINVANNYNNTATFSNKSPSGGQIVLTQTYLQFFAHLNGFTIVEKGTAVEPTANAGPNQEITLPTSVVTMAGSGTANNGGSITTHVWTKFAGGAATITDANSYTTTITGLVAGNYVFRLTVTDNDGGVATSDVAIKVNPQNQLPTVDPGPPQTIKLPVNQVLLVAIANDPDGSISTYAWTQISGTAATISNPSFASTNVTGLTTAGVRVFRITVTDNKGGTATGDVTITVNAANIPPIPNAGLPQTIALPTSSVTLSGSASDPDGTIASYAWSQVSGTAATIASPSTASTNITGLSTVGKRVFRLTVTDNEGATATSDVEITVEPTNVNTIFTLLYERFKKGL